MPKAIHFGVATKVGAGFRRIIRAQQNTIPERLKEFNKLCEIPVVLKQMT
jgi:hypothetical protein